MDRVGLPVTSLLSISVWRQLFSVLSHPRVPECNAYYQSSSDADLSLNRNPFIETALAYALSYISNEVPGMITPAHITILADNSYYSTSSPSSRFHDFGVPLSAAHKTGLGSSAALVTAFTAALLSHYLPSNVFDLHSERGRRRVHNLAQAAHCAAQGKVGSGFDVASAVFGSCLYRRFSPSILTSQGEPASPNFAANLRNLINESGEGAEWDTEILKDRVKVPQGLRLIMCDVSCGSQTPGMVKQVLKWRQDTGEEAEELWRRLQQSNEDLAQELVNLAENGGSYDKLKDCIGEIRTYIRKMSAMSGVPIEPPAQTELIDACCQIEGVIGGVVPGAGGYDAIALLIEDKEEVIQKLAKLLDGWEVKTQAEEGPSVGKVSILGVREEMQGVRMEDSRGYGDWIEYALEK